MAVDRSSTLGGQPIVFRVDASIEIGSGHVMRCLTLAEELRRNNRECIFICRALSGNLGNLITQKGFALYVLSAPTHQSSDVLFDELSHASWLGVSWRTDATETREILASLNAKWLVVDHYALDARWEQEVASTVERIMVIDDLADRTHKCDVLLDQNLGRQKADYALRVPETCQLLIGPMYALLRPEFALQREISLGRRRAHTSLKNILINLGGVDKDNITGQVLQALKVCHLPANCKITVIMGATAPWLDNVNVHASVLPWQTEVIVNVPNMSHYMAEADLAIGAAGSTSWERCCLGLPSIVFELAANQKEIMTALNEAKAVVGFCMPIDACSLDETLNTMATSHGLLRDMSESAAEICDGKGAYRVEKYI